MSDTVKLSIDELNTLIDYLYQQRKCYEHCTHVNVWLSEDQMNFILGYLCYAKDVYDRRGEGEVKL